MKKILMMAVALIALGVLSACSTPKTTDYNALIRSIKNSTNATIELTHYYFNEDTQQEEVAYSDVFKFDGYKFETTRAGEEDSLYFAYVEDGIYKTRYYSYEEEDYIVNPTTDLGNYSSPEEKFDTENRNFFRNNPWFFEPEYYAVDKTTYTLKKDTQTVNNLLSHVEFYIAGDDVKNGVYTVIISASEKVVTFQEICYQENGNILYKTVYKVTNLNSTSITIPQA